jgi:hypothetical protein
VLAYFAAASLDAKESFITLTFGVNVAKVFNFITDSVAAN